MSPAYLFFSRSNIFIMYEENVPSCVTGSLSLGVVVASALLAPSAVVPCQLGERPPAMLACPCFSAARLPGARVTSVAFRGAPFPAFSNLPCMLLRLKTSACSWRTPRAVGGGVLRRT